jgi:hypothetical protein
MLQACASAVPIALALCLLGLWGRSYWRQDVVWINCSPAGLVLNSRFGHISVEAGWNDAFYSGWTGPHYRAIPASESPLRESSTALPVQSYCRKYNTCVYGLCAPHWYWAIPLLAIAARPWRRRRFTLRTLLASITFVALWLMLWILMRVD